jgi:hypothetical protein
MITSIMVVMFFIFGLIVGNSIKVTLKESDDLNTITDDLEKEIIKDIQNTIKNE